MQGEDVLGEVAEHVLREGPKRLKTEVLRIDLVRRGLVQEDVVLLQEVSHHTREVV